MALKASQKNQFDTSYVTITTDATYYNMVSDGMPNHNYSDSVNRFPAQPTNYNFDIPRNPVLNSAGPSCVSARVGITLYGKHLTV